jgi:hypothetical protein
LRTDRLFLTAIVNSSLQARAPDSGSGFVEEALKERLLVQLNTAHGDGRSHSIHGIIPAFAVLPFCKDALIDQQPELGVAEPYRRQIGSEAANSGHQIDTDHSVFADTSTRQVCGNLVQESEIVFGDGRYRRASLCCFDEGSEELQSFLLFV